MIYIGSTNVSQAFNLTVQDASGRVENLDVTGMKIEARFYDVGLVGRWSGSYDYGFQHWGSSALVTLTQEGGGVVVDDVDEGQIHLVMTPAESRQLACNTILRRVLGKRRLVRQIWRTDTGLESMLREDTEWARQ